MPQTIDRTELAVLIAHAALLRGTFTLRSGRTSSYYLDKYLFTTRPEILEPVARLLAERVAAIEAETGPVHRLAGAELGGIPLVTAASLRTGKPCVLVRNQKKHYGTAKQLEGKAEAGERVVLLEDVATTAGQALEAVKSLRGMGLEVAGVVAVIDRQEGAAANMAAAGVRFEALFTKADLGVGDESPWRSQDGLRSLGFSGFVPVQELRGKTERLPSAPGVYVVLAKSLKRPDFLDVNPGGHFKDKDPSVDHAQLEANWVDGTIVLYMGQAGAGTSNATLRTRVKQLLEFGAGRPVGHWGGRLLWQLADSDSHIIAWRETLDQDARAVEAELLSNFHSEFGALPFANLRG